MEKELYLKILEDFPNPIWRCGTDAKCNFFNKAWLDFTGRTIEQEYGDGWAQGVHPDDLDGCYKGFIESFNRRESFLLEYRLRHRDGTYHTILDFGSPFFTDGEVFAGYIGSCYDITDRKLAEEEQKKLLEELKLKLAEESRLNQELVTRETKIRELNLENEKAIEELKTSLATVKMLKGMLPICASCKKVRNDKGYWERIELYIERNSEAEFTHGICPECAGKLKLEK